MAPPKNKIQVYLKEDVIKALQAYKTDKSIETDSQAINHALSLFFALHDEKPSSECVTIHDYRETTRRLDNQIDSLTYKYLELMKVFQAIQATTITTTNDSTTTTNDSKDIPNGNETTNDSITTTEVTSINDEIEDKNTNDSNTTTNDYQDEVEELPTTTDDYQDEVEELTNGDDTHAEATDGSEDPAVDIDEDELEPNQDQDAKTEVEGQQQLFTTTGDDGVTGDNEQVSPIEEKEEFTLVEGKTYEDSVKLIVDLSDAKIPQSKIIEQLIAGCYPTKSGRGKWQQSLVSTTLTELKKASNADS